MSLLTRQLALAKDAFLTRYPHAWLVWEPGEWAVPRSGVDVSVAETRLPDPAHGEGPRPLQGDALAFGLKAPEGAVLHVGRAAENDIVISDMTVSRIHAQLELKAGAWLLTALSDDKQTKLGGQVLTRGAAVPLTTGATLELGGVKLAFHDAAAFRDRVANVPLRPGR